MAIFTGVSVLFNHVITLIERGGHPWSGTSSSIVLIGWLLFFKKKSPTRLDSSCLPLLVCIFERSNREISTKGDKRIERLAPPLAPPQIEVPYPYRV